MSVTHRVAITSLGREGDGVAQIGARSYYFPHLVPGDVLDLQTDEAGHCLGHHLVSPAPHAMTPPCTIFTQCGGCATQRLPFPDQLNWKRARVQAALERAGFDVPVPTLMHQSAPRSRRRVDLAVVKSEEGVVIGLHQRKSAPIDMTSCQLLDPRIFALVAPLRELMRRLGAISREADLHINLFDSGADIVIGANAAPSLSDRGKIAAFAAAHRIPRICWRQGKSFSSAPEVIAQLRPVTHHFSGTTLSPPPGSFMQPTASGEAAIIAAVCDALPKLNKRDRITELYSGMGTLTLPLSAHGFVEAYEGAASSVAALDAARTGRRLSCSVRDLARQPLQQKELEKSRLVVVDPPRIGAGTQAARVAASGVKDVIYVSCNPQALVNDLAPFVRQGYGLLSWSVIDQFLWSAEVEAVVALTLDRKRLAKRLA
ncbi:23S rRNA m(5)U-1939 methyltransferase [Acetobacteraceae bacterium EV16G]|uniref:23S rRNA m(5)U-1939 methyltransferase n=1 Tax=Sorlinia euscelidii TaxID=3081148 RepID=A0ABU7U6M0_9PROT